MPDDADFGGDVLYGGAGWALYFSLFATFSPAIQLGFGFGLAGVGMAAPSG